MTEHDDKAAIVEIINLYGLALDAHEWELFDRDFTEDVTAELGPAWPTSSAPSLEFHDRLDSHQHTMMGHLVHVDADTAHALSDGNWLLVRASADGGPSWLGPGRYDDELVRTDRGWRIHRRVCRLLSWTGNPLVPEPDQEHHPDMNPDVLHRHAQEGKIAFLCGMKGK